MASSSPSPVPTTLHPPNKQARSHSNNFQPKRLTGTRFFTADAERVKIYVGEERKLWILPQEFICQLDYFKRAFKGGFKEANEKEISMKEDDPAAFGLLIDWLFRSEPEELSKPMLLSNQSMQSGKVSAQELSQMCKLFVLANKIGELYLASKTYDQIHTLLFVGSGHISTELVEYVFRNTPDTSQLRLGLVELAANFFFMKDTDGFEQCVDAICSNSTFNREVTEEVRNHIALEPHDDECGFYCCKLAR